MTLEHATSTRSAPGAGLFREPRARLEWLRAIWPRAVGDAMARRTEVASWRGDTVTVRVPDRNWWKAVQKNRRAILDRLYGRVGRGAPRRLTLIEGEVTPRARAGARPSIAVVARPLPAAIEASAETIPDHELRDAFRRAAARYLGRFSESDEGDPPHA